MWNLAVGLRETELEAQVRGLPQLFTPTSIMRMRMSDFGDKPILFALVSKEDIIWF